MVKRHWLIIMSTWREHYWNQIWWHLDKVVQRKQHRRKLHAQLWRHFFVLCRPRFLESPSSAVDSPRRRLPLIWMRLIDIPRRNHGPWPSATVVPFRPPFFALGPAKRTKLTLVKMNSSRGPKYFYFHFLYLSFFIINYFSNFNLFFLSIFNSLLFLSNICSMKPKIMFRIW